MNTKAQSVVGTAAGLLRGIRTQVGHPATARELMRVFGVPREDRQVLRRQLRRLVEAGDLIRIRGNRYGVPDCMSLVSGRLTMNPRGFGFVTPEQASGGDDIFVSGTNLHQAMHGDRVTVRVEHVSGRQEGRVVRVLERANDDLVGRFVIDESGMGFVVPFDPRLVMDLRIPAGETAGAESGHMVVAGIDRWPTSARGPTGRVLEVLGHLDDPGVDTALIIRKYRIPETHSPAAVNEATRLGYTIRARDRDGRTDFRDRTTVTIDSESARDFDDAITIETLPNGCYWLGVHIADVAHYVAEGGALDNEAYARGTSVYFPERALHMFPEALATGLCSLKPGVDRLVQSCLMEVDRYGKVVRYELHDGIIHSDARMTYTDVDAVLSARDPVVRDRYAALAPMFERMATVARRLAARRARRGSIDFDFKATQLVFDEVGMVEDIVAADRTVAHRLIEEFMLIANETVARHLATVATPTLFRVHERPDPEKVAEFETFASTLGHGLRTPLTRVRPGHFRRLLKRLHGTPEERPVALLMLRTMQKARYDTSNVGHFGLASDSYTHFTSPIRRYPDLVVHRLLRESRRGPVSPERGAVLEETLPAVARHTSALERRAEEAEREVVEWKKVRFMTDKVGVQFTGHVTGVTGFGLFVELIEYFVGGLVHISSMVDDYYRHVEGEQCLHGESTGKTYRLGDEVSVQVVRVDTDRRQIDLGIVEILDAVKERRLTRRGKHRSVTRRKHADARDGHRRDRRRKPR